MTQKNQQTDNLPVAASVHLQAPKNTNRKFVVKPKIDVGKALKLRLRGLSYSEIAKIFQVHKQAVYKAIRSFEQLIADPQELKAYKNNEADVLSAVSLKLLRRLVDEDVLAKATANNLAYAFTQVNTAKRLAANQATGHIGVVVEHKLASALEASRKAKDKS